MYSNISLQGNGGQKEAETQADTLFTTHSIIEIKRVEQKMRLEIEQKKEDLRQMVGERYRDLIEAADSVIAMKDESLHVTKLLSNVQASCQQLQQTHFLKGTGGQRTPSTLSSVQLLALQMKLLVELQEEMRQRHDSGHLLSAAISYLLLRHIATHLTTATDTATSSSLVAMVTRLWKRVSSFKTTVANSAKSYLRSSQLDRKLTQDALCTIVLLEDISFSQSFVEFLSARKDAVLDLFGPSQQGRSVKVTIQDLILIVYQTLDLTADLFSCNSGTTKLLTALESLSNPNKAPCKHIIPPSLLNTLPRQICNYAAHLHGSMESIPQSALGTQCQQWVTSCCAEVHPRLSEVLTHVKSLKALASVRDTAYQILSKDSSTPVSLQAARTKWTSICQDSIGQSLSIYSSFIHPLLVEQAKTVVEELVTRSEIQLVGALRELLEQHAAQPDEFAVDRDMLSFLWEEKEREKGRQSMSSVLESLQLKAECCTPHIHQFCQNFDNNLKQLEADLHQFTHDKSSTSASQASRAKPIIGEEFPFSRYADSQVLQQHISSRLAVTIDRFLDKIDVAVNTAVKELSKKGSCAAAAGTPMDRVLLLARLCQNLSKFCPSLQQLVELEGDRPRYHITTTAAHSKTKTSLAGTTQTKLKLLLDQKGAELIRMWSGDCCQQFTAQLREYLFSVSDLVHLSGVEVWEEIEIHEEAEGGRKVSTTIQIPCQASVYIQALLYALTREISYIGGHNIDRNALVQLSRDVFDGALASYIELLQCNSSTPTVLGQDCALQILFDVQFLSMIFSHGSSESSISQKLSQVTDALHSCIDPFDLDVFTPLMAARLQRQLQRSSVMLGLLTGLKDSVLKRGGSVGSSASSSSQEKPVILPLASVVPRIPLLPIPNQQAVSQTRKTDRSDTQETTNNYYLLKFGGLEYLYV